MSDLPKIEERIKDILWANKTLNELEDYELMADLTKAIASLLSQVETKAKQKLINDIWDKATELERERGTADESYLAVAYFEDQLTNKKGDDNG